MPHIPEYIRAEIRRQQCAARRSWESTSCATVAALEAELAKYKRYYSAPVRVEVAVELSSPSGRELRN